MDVNQELRDENIALKDTISSQSSEIELLQTSISDLQLENEDITEQLKRVSFELIDYKEELDKTAKTSLIESNNSSDPSTQDLQSQIESMSEQIQTMELEMTEYQNELSKSRKENLDLIENMRELNASQQEIQMEEMLLTSSMRDTSAGFSEYSEKYNECKLELENCKLLISNFGRENNKLKKENDSYLSQLNALLKHESRLKQTIESEEDAINKLQFDYQRLGSKYMKEHEKLQIIKHDKQAIEIEYQEYRATTPRASMGNGGDHETFFSANDSKNNDNEMQQKSSFRGRTPTLIVEPKNFKFDLQSGFPDAGVGDDDDDDGSGSGSASGSVTMSNDNDRQTEYEYEDEIVPTIAKKQSSGYYLMNGNDDGSDDGGSGSNDSNDSNDVQGIIEERVSEMSRIHEERMVIIKTEKDKLNERLNGEESKYNEMKLEFDKFKIEIEFDMNESRHKVLSLQKELRKAKAENRNHTNEPASTCTIFGWSAF